MENECEALPGVAYPGVRDNRSTINTKTGYDDRELDICLINWRCLYGNKLLTDANTVEFFCV